MDRRLEIGQMAFVVTGLILAVLGVDERDGDVTTVSINEAAPECYTLAARE
jgi:hypothetical protein